jgi:hypothetical protein
LGDRYYGRKSCGMHFPTTIRELLQLHYTVALIKISQLSDALLSFTSDISMIDNCVFHENEGFPKTQVRRGTPHFRLVMR